MFMQVTAMPPPNCAKRLECGELAPAFEPPHALRQRQQAGRSANASRGSSSTRTFAAREHIGARYSQLLRDVCAVPEVAPSNTHVYAQYTIRVANRDELGTRLKAAGIPTAVYYPKCLHEQPVFAPLGYRWGDFPVAERASREVISLPMHPFLNEAEQDNVVAAVRAAVQTRSIESP